MRIVSFLVLLLCAQCAYAQLFVDQCTTLLNSTLTSTTTGDIKKLTTYGNIKALSFVAIADANSGTPTLDVTVEGCLNDTSTPYCSTLATFDQCTTGTCWSSTGNRQVIDLNEASVNLFPYVRAKATLGGSSPNYDVLVRACFKQ